MSTREEAVKISDSHLEYGIVALQLCLNWSGIFYEWQSEMKSKLPNCVLNAAHSVEWENILG